MCDERDSYFGEKRMKVRIVYNNRTCVYHVQKRFLWLFWFTHGGSFYTEPAIFKSFDRAKDYVRKIMMPKYTVIGEFPSEESELVIMNGVEIPPRKKN